MNGDDKLMDQFSSEASVTNYKCGTYISTEREDFCNQNHRVQPLMQYNGMMIILVDDLSSASATPETSYRCAIFKVKRGIVLVIE